MITLKKLNKVIKLYSLDLTAGKPSFMSNFVLVEGNDLFKNRIAEGKSLRELLAVVEYMAKVKGNFVKYEISRI